MQRAIPSDPPAAATGPRRALHRKLRRAAGLGSGEWRVVLRAAIWLAVVRAGLRFLGFQRLDGLASRGLPAASAAPDPARGAELARLLDIAARNALPPATCLPRSLVLRRLLRREGLPATLHIGVARLGDVALHAHAWVTSGGTVVADAPDIAERFAELVPGAEHLAALAEAPADTPRRHHSAPIHQGDGESRPSNEGDRSQ